MLSALSRQKDQLVQAASALPPLTWRERGVVYLGLAAVAAACWAYLVWHVGAHGGHAADALHAGALAREFAPVFFMWSVMMAAMMLPTALPAAGVFAALDKRRARKPGGAYAFVLGYLLAWVFYSALAAALQLALHAGGLLDAAGAAGELAGGATLLIAGLYQWTPWKLACLKKCRSPLGFLLQFWRDGPAGAARLGLRYGWYCVGCCWALMAVMFAVGVMNLLWMAVITAFALIEKAFPPGIGARRFAGWTLSLWGAWRIYLHAAA